MHDFRYPNFQTTTRISKEVSGNWLKKVKLSMNTRLVFVSFDKIAKKLNI